MDSVRHNQAEQNQLDSYHTLARSCESKKESGNSEDRSTYKITYRALGNIVLQNTLKMWVIFKGF